jgi:hypothetical protein
MLARTPDRAASTPIFTGWVCPSDGTLANELAAIAPLEILRKSLRLWADMIVLRLML